MRASAAVFCASLWADRLAVACGAPRDPRIVPFRGGYLELTGGETAAVRGNVYPVPNPELPFLGAHVTRTLDRRVLVGPSALLAPARDAYRLGTVRPRDLAETLAWPGTWRLARKHWRTGVRELRHAASRVPSSPSGAHGAGTARRPHQNRARRHPRPGPGSRRLARRRLRRPSHRAGDPRAQRAFPGSDLLARAGAADCRRAGDARRRLSVGAGDARQ